MTLLLAALPAACRGEADPRAAPPAFAEELSGRACVVAWSPTGAPIPPPVHALVAALPAELGLRAVQHRDALVLESPADLAVGWPSLAESRLFQRALGGLAAAGAEPGAASMLVYVDLQQLVELLRRAMRQSMRGWQIDRLERGLGLRGLDSLALAARQRDGALQGAGVLATTGSELGLPGALTAAAPARMGAARDGGARVQIELSCADEVLPRMARVMSDLGDGASLFGGVAAAPLASAYGVVRHLAGRASLVLRGRATPTLTAAVAVGDEPGLRSALRDLPMLGGARGALPGVEIDDGWMLLGPGADVPPESGEERAGPWLSVWAEWPLSGAVELRAEVHVEGARADLAHLRWRLW